MTGQELTQPLNRLGVFDAGETTLNLIAAVREYRGEHACDLRVVAMYTNDDAGSMWVREADEAVLVASSKWNDAAIIEQALSTAAVDAVWDGAGSVDSATRARQLLRSPRHPACRCHVGSTADSSE